MFIFQRSSHFYCNEPYNFHGNQNAFDPPLFFNLFTALQESGFASVFGSLSSQLSGIDLAQLSSLWLL